MRIVLAPCIAYCLITGDMYSAFGIFFLAAITDFCDGFFARFLGQVSILGAFLDVCADKLLLGAVFGSLLYVGYNQVPCLTWYVCVVIFKELMQICGYMFLWLISKSVRIQPTIVGKVSTFLNIVLVFWLFFIYFFDSFYPLVHYILISVSTFFLVISFIQYVTIGMLRFFRPQTQ